MPVQNLKYCEYFDVNEKYFPCIDESAINSGAAWDTTYPHQTFIDLLNRAEKMLSGNTNRSIWIHGAYGTGKSQCAYTLKKLLEVPETEVRNYWDKFEPLKKNHVLLEKLIGHKAQGIVTAYRYASGSISTPQQLFFAVQESIKKGLEANEVSYKGENSLKESVIAWLEDPIHNQFMDALLQKPKWRSTFSQSSADEIINTLKKSSDVSSLMDDIFSLAAEEGITALNLSADSLRKWIIDIIDKNNIKLVLIWDEFSDYFRQNSTSLGEFQKIVSICQEKPFYFVIVTHPLSSLAKEYDSRDKTNPWSVVQQRFDKVEITLPDNIAFELIGHAFSVKPAAKANWKRMTEDLNSYVTNARKAVIKAANINDQNVMRDILPIHPIAALVLKNIASAFQSNQRSMFDFIKTPKDMDVNAFQWFIQNTSPLSDRPFLTVDMLWDFFYEKGKDYLSSDIRLILDTFQQQAQLNDKEKIVLKTVLIMQSIDQRLGGALPILKPTDQNLSYAFEGDTGELESSCKSIAKALVNKGILIENPIANGKKVYSAAVLAGDGAKIEAFKKEIREKQGTTAKLVSEGAAVATALSLPPALKLRYALELDSGKLPVVTMSDFKKVMDVLKSKDVDWHFYAVLALAKTDEEAQSFRTLIKKIIADPAYKNIAVIDALSTPLGLEAFEQYVDYSAMSMYYSGNNGQQSKENAKKAKDVLERDWKDQIHNGQFIVFTYANQDGEKAAGAGAVHTIMQTIVLKRFKHVQDFTKGLSETQLKLTTPKPVAKYGMGVMEIKGLISGCEKSVLGKFWSKKEYWKDEELAGEHIVIIKKSVDKMIDDAFKSSGKISIGEIYDYLETTYGFSVCNLSAFITGFLLKEYSSEPYRSMDAEGHRDSMTPDKLSEMIGNYIGKNPKATYIVNLTPEEKAFYELTENAWNITANTCSSPQQAGTLVLAKMRDLSYPVWCLEDMDTAGVFDLVKLYIKLVQSKGDKAHDVANEIGKIAIQRPSSAQNLKALLTLDNCKKGMHIFLERFENGKLLNVAKEINAEDSVLSDIKKLFNVQYSALWIGSTGEDEIRKLITEYEVVKSTNIFLNVTVRSKEAAFKAWRETLKFIGFSCESIRAKKPALDKFFYNLLRIANYEDMLPDNMKSFLDEMTNHNAEIRNVLGNTLAVFIDIYAPYLEGFTDTECEEIKNSITSEMFTISSTASNAIVKKAAEDYRKNQVKSQLYKLWSDKSGGSKNPRVWSEKYRTPILCCVNASLYAEAKKAFATLNSSMQSEADIKEALAFIKEADFFDEIASADYRDKCFAKRIIGDYTSLISDIDAVRDTLESTGISAYEWNDNPTIMSKVSSMAAAEYNAGGSDKVVDIIEGMNDAELKKWLTDIVRKDMGLGVKIIINREG
ncbi:hypothetical protein DW050_08760 [Ruminococcus sp. AF42-10]|jgi:hypothetical protein|nr:hypothetical protein [Ruminococcus sp. AF42-10]RGF39652.1 hypothetical protein DW050_08760 [Ruminococcus sp. AF42-10]